MATRIAAWLGVAVVLTACGGGAGGDDEAPDDGSPGALADGGGAVDDAATLDPDAALPGATPDAGAEAGPPAVAVPRPMELESFGWKTCADTLQCGSLRVPIDYAHPEAGTLKLAVMRRLASGTRTGALLLNPGGPGASAIDFLGAYVQGADSQLLERYDLVAVDPRGVGYGTALDCHSTLEQLIAADPTPDDEAEWKTLDDRAAAFAAECAQDENAALLPFLGTPNVARDMDTIRAALGEEKLNFLGFSYGTSLGAWYAELFPTRVGRFVLDGPVDLGESAFDHTLNQARGFDLALAHYFDWCKAVATRCTWTNGVEPAQALAALTSAVDAAPIPAPKANRPLGPGELSQAVFATLYGGTEGWRALSPALKEALAGDASTLMTFVDGYYERNADGGYPNLQEMFYAVSCIDQYAPTVAEIRAAVPRFTSEAPVFGLANLSTMLVCAHWPVPGRDVPPPTGQGAPPIVVLGALNDPATPYAGAQAFAADLRSSVLLTAHIEGHTSYQRGDKCVDNGVDGFLFEGVIPVDTCAASPTKSLPGGALIHDSTWARLRR